MGNLTLLIQNLIQFILLVLKPMFLWMLRRISQFTWSKAFCISSLQRRPGSLLYSLESTHSLATSYIHNLPALNESHLLFAQLFVHHLFQSLCPKFGDNLVNTAYSTDRPEILEFFCSILLGNYLFLFIFFSLPF